MRRIVSSTTQHRKDTPPKKAADLCSEALRDLEQALEQFSVWDVRVPENGRVRDALGVLAATAEKNEFPGDSEDRRRVANAIVLANDFSDIANYLDTPLTSDSHEALRRAVKGRLDQAGTQRSAYQAQSELWVRAVLVRGGFQPYFATPSIGRPRPDYIVEIGSLRYGVEVKRPQNAATIIRNLEKARDQLNGYGINGVVFMDLTDCLAPEQPLTGNGEIARLIAVLQEQMWDRRGPRSGYDHVWAVAVVARGVEVEVNPPLFHVVHYSACTRFGGVRGSLRFWHAEDLTQGIATGLAVLGEHSHPDVGWNRSIKDAGSWRGDTQRS